MHLRSRFAHRLGHAGNVSSMLDELLDEFPA
jgi:hypothetical protein